MRHIINMLIIQTKLNIMTIANIISIMSEKERKKERKS